MGNGNTRRIRLSLGFILINHRMPLCSDTISKSIMTYGQINTARFSVRGSWIRCKLREHGWKSVDFILNIRWRKGIIPGKSFASMNCIFEETKSMVSLALFLYLSEKWNLLGAILAWHRLIQFFFNISQLHWEYSGISQENVNEGSSF